MKDLIKIINFNNEEATVYFGYLGDIDRDLNIRISSNNLTIYYTKLTLSVNSDLVYYVGFDTSIVNRIGNFDLTIWDDELFFEHHFEINNQLKKIDRFNR